MYSVYDRKMHEYQGIALSHSLPVFVRLLRESVRGTLVEKYPSDFEVHRLGRFNTNTGEFFTESLRPQVVAQVDAILDGSYPSRLPPGENADA